MSQSTFLSPDAAHHQQQQQQQQQLLHQQQQQQHIHPSHLQHSQLPPGFDAFGGTDSFFSGDALWGMGGGGAAAQQMVAAMSAPPPAQSSTSAAGSPASNGRGPSGSSAPMKRRTGSSMGRSPSNADGASPLHLQAAQSAHSSQTSSPNHQQTAFFGGGAMASSPTSQQFTSGADASTTTPGPHRGNSHANTMGTHFTMPDRSDSLQSLSGFDLKMGDDQQQQQQGTPGSSGERGASGAAGTSGADGAGEGADSAAEKNKSSRFVFKLMRMVSDPESQHLISFNPSGTSVVVTNFDDFAKEVLPKHFKHSNFSSFIRQLNMYGFYKVNKTPRGQRTTNDSQVWEFSHPKFIRGRTDLLEEIRRKALDNDHARVEARDLRFNVSLGQLQVRHHLEEMQWRLDQTMEQNFQLREFGLAMRDVVAQVLEYIKATNGGQMPFEVRLPQLDPLAMMHSPMPPASPFGPPPPGGPGSWNMLPSQPSPQMHSGPQMGMMGPPGHAVHHQQQQHQQDRPSIFVTEPIAVGPGHHHNQAAGMVGSVPPSPQDMNGAFSMSSMGNVSPFGPSSRRVSGSSDRPDFPSNNPEYFAMSSVFDDGSGGQGSTDNMGGQATIRPGFANLPRRSLSSRSASSSGGGGLNIQTNLPEGGQMMGAPGSAGAGPGAAGGPGPQHAHLGMPGGAPLNPGLGVMGAPSFADPSSFQQQQHFQQAINTPLPPSPAIPGYHPHAQSMTPQQHHAQQHSNQQGNNYPHGAGGSGGLSGMNSAAAAAAAAHFQSAFGPGGHGGSGGVSPSMLSAPSFDAGSGMNAGASGSAMGTPALSSSPSSSLPSALLDDGDDEDDEGGPSNGLGLDDDEDGDDTSNSTAADTSLDLLSAPSTADTVATSTTSASTSRHSASSSISKRNKKAMRTPLKRTASGNNEAMGTGLMGMMTPAGADAMGTPTGRGAMGQQGQGKRKTPH